MPSTQQDSNPRLLKFLPPRHVLYRCATTAAETCFQSCFRQISRKRRKQSEPNNWVFFSNKVLKATEINPPLLLGPSNQVLNEFWQWNPFLTYILPPWSPSPLFPSQKFLRWKVRERERESEKVREGGNKEWGIYLFPSTSDYVPNFFPISGRTRIPC